MARYIANTLPPLEEPKLAFAAVRACVTGDLGGVRDVLVSDETVAAALADAYPDELLFGRAGLLDLLRMVRHSGCRQPGRWSRGLAVAEGLGDGGPRLVQFCHGAPGIVVALEALRPHHPALQGRIDAAVEAARRCVWEQGILRKEPSLCHGLLGNALSLSPPQRGHFLALATPDRMAEMKRADADLFARADYGRDGSVLTSYAPSAAWTWLACGEARVIFFFNDV